MLTSHQKHAILKKAGVQVPDAPARHLDMPSHLSDTSHAGWSRTVEILFVNLTAARAARSLREAEETRIMSSLRDTSWNDGVLRTRAGVPALR